MRTAIGAERLTSNQLILSGYYCLRELTSAPMAASRQSLQDGEGLVVAGSGRTPGIRAVAQRQAAAGHLKSFHCQD